MVKNNMNKRGCCLNFNEKLLNCLKSEHLKNKGLDATHVNLDNARIVFGYVAQLVRAPHS